MSTPQATDVVLVNRAGTDYTAAQSRFDAAVQATDKLLLNRGGVDYSVTKADLAIKGQLTDLLLVNRGGTDYKCTLADWNASLSAPPVIGSVTLADVAGGHRYTGVGFPVTLTMTNDGKPASSKGLKAWVEGSLEIQPITDVMTGSAEVAGVATVTLKSDSGLTNFHAGDLVWQDDAKIPTVFTEHEIEATNKRLEAIGASDTTAIAAGASYNNAYVSHDGINWTVHALPHNQVSGPVLHVTNKTWVIPAEQTTKTNPLNVLYSNNDGTSWAIKELLPARTTTVYMTKAVQYNGGLGLLVERSNSTSKAVEGYDYFSTTNGSTWTHHVIPAASIATSKLQVNSLRAACASPDGMTIYAFPAAHPVAVSKDGGRTFAPLTSQAFTAPADAVVVSGLLYVIYTTTTTQTLVSISSDGGATYVTHTPTGLNRVASIQHANGMFLVTFSNSSSIGFSTDALTWTIVNNVFSSGGGTQDSWINGITEFKGRVIAIAPFKEDSRHRPVGHTRVAYTDAWAPSGFVRSVDTATHTMVIERSTGGWSANTNNRVVSFVKLLANARLYTVHDAAGAVTDLTSADPGFVTMTGNGPYTLTFPATFPTGKAPDVDLPSGTKLTAEIEAKNSGGTVQKTSTTITPA